jgi:hypothetical protein
MKAPRTRKLMMLSSTINTLIGGTELSNKPGGRLGVSPALDFFRLSLRRGDATRGVGGFELCRTGGSTAGAGGVGREGLPEDGERLGSDDADESWRGRCAPRAGFTGAGTEALSVVGEWVFCRGALGRPRTFLLALPGEGMSGKWPVEMTVMEGDGLATGIGGK